jgi:hypothetical protein
MMFETVTTNAAGIATIIVLWSTVTWAITYLYMSEKIRRKDETIRFLDDYIEADQTYMDLLREHIRDLEKDYGHVIDDYIDHYYSEGKWVQA